MYVSQPVSPASSCDLWAIVAFEKTNCSSCDPHPGFLRCIAMISKDLPISRLLAINDIFYSLNFSFKKRMRGTYLSRLGLSRKKWWLAMVHAMILHKYFLNTGLIANHLFTFQRFAQLYRAQGFFLSFALSSLLDLFLFEWWWALRRFESSSSLFFFSSC